MINKFIRTILLIIVILITACSGEYPNNLRIEEGQLLLKLSLPVEHTTRTWLEEGENNLNENLLEDIELLFYDDNNLIWHVPRSSFKMSHTNHPNQKQLLINASTEIAHLLRNKNLQLIAIANGPKRSILEDKSLQQLKNLIIKTTSLNGSTPQESFIMEGSKTTGNIVFNRETAYDLGTLSLSRVAAKIRLKINSLQVDGYQIGTARAMLVNYLDETTLLDSNGKLNNHIDFNYKQTAYQDLIEIKYGSTSFFTTNLPYYSYENNWLSTDIQETYILLEIPFTANNFSRNYYYRIPLNYRLGNESTRIRRNHLYEIDVDISEIGNISGEVPIELASSVTVKTWKEQDLIHAYLNKADFLVVKENSIIMTNTNSHKVEYISNTPVCLPNQVTASFTGYDQSGKEFSGIPNTIPTVQFEESKGKKHIIINSPVPTNYVPLKIEFTIENEAKLKEKIKIIQYPAKYITANKSNGEYYTSNINNGPTPGNHTNFNLFKVTTTLGDDNEIIGDPTDNSGNTKGDAESNKIISPQFIIGSQYGVTQLTSYNNAKRHCANYYEDQYGPNQTMGGQWRIPTKAELEYINRLQKNTNSAVKELFKGEAYWAAEEFYYYNFLKDSWSSNSLNIIRAAHIRCVYDIYKHKKKEK